MRLPFASLIHTKLKRNIQNIFLKQDKSKVSVPELTDNIKENNTYLINRAKERFVNYEKDKNTFKNYKDIAEIVGVGIPDKTAQDFFQTKLRNANKKIGIRTKKGFGKEILYNLGDAVNALTKVNLTKLQRNITQKLEKTWRAVEIIQVGQSDWISFHILSFRFRCILTSF